jgi:hypothetical protein
MKYMLLVHHDEEAFGKFSEAKREQMLAESVQLTTSSTPTGNILALRRCIRRRRRPSFGSVTGKVS